MRGWGTIRALTNLIFNPSFPSHFLFPGNFESLETHRSDQKCSEIEQGFATHGLHQGF